MWGEVLAALVVVCVLGAVMVVAASRSRTLGSLGQTMTNLRQMADAFASYGGDYQDRVLGYSWSPGHCPSQYADLKTAADVITAFSNQAVDVLRRRSGNETFVKVIGWLPQPAYFHLVIADYLNVPLPHGMFQSPEDKGLLEWSLDPAHWHAGTSNDRWALSTSYETTAGCWGGPDAGSAINQDGLSFNLFSIPGGWTGSARQLSEITYPAQKALVFDRYQRHFGARVGYFMYDEARVPIAAADGSVAVRAGLNTNPGWKPAQTSSPNPSLLLYQPGSSGPFVLPPPLYNTAGDTVKGRLRYTRRGLGGRDFDGAEVP